MPFTSMRVVNFLPNTTVTTNGLPSNPKKRAEHIIGLVRSAHEELNNAYGEEEDVLRIFLAPEWTFRFPRNTDPTATKAISKHQRNVIIRTFIAASEEFPNWLIIPGSICWGNLHKNVEVDQNTIRNELHWYNTAFAVNDGSLYRYYHKQHDADSMPSTYRKNRKEYTVIKPAIISHEGPEGRVREKDIGTERPSVIEWRANPDNYRPVPSPRAKSPFFPFDGKTFAIEICADFAGVTALRQYLDEDENGSGVDVHIVIAAGIPPDEYYPTVSLACSRGYLLLCNCSVTNNLLTSSKVYKILDREGNIAESAINYDDLIQSVQSEIHSPTIGTNANWSGDSEDRNECLLIYQDLFDFPQNMPIENIL